MNSLMEDVKELLELTQEQFDELKKDESTFDEVCKKLWNHEYANTFDSVAELGADYSDSALREDDDTDESFGNFLISAYKTGNSNGTVFFEFSDGKVLVI